MNISVCDDSFKDSGALENIIYEYYSNNTNLFQCDIFSSGEEFISNQEKNKKYYQIYFLDIEMNEVDGLQVANYIRSYDINAIIVFTTKHSEMVYKAFDVNAFHYLVKPINKALVEKVLIKANKFLAMKNTLFQFKCSKKMCTINYDQIIYFESQKRKIVIYTENEKYTYYGTIKQLNETLNPNLFAQIHNSYIINMEYILSIENKEVLLKNDTELNVSRKFYVDFMKYYREFILARLQ